jgi:hypothetical protein
MTLLPRRERIYSGNEGLETGIRKPTMRKMSPRAVRRADKDLVRAVALDMLGEHGIERAPVDPFAIAESLGIVVQASEELEGSFSGCLLRAGASFGILYSTGIRNKGYHRFTVAHELGHFRSGSELYPLPNG